jgi:hypothetical protein
MRLPACEKQNGQAYTFDTDIIFSSLLTILLNLLSFAVFWAIRRYACVIPDCPISKRKPISLNFIPL